MNAVQRTVLEKTRAANPCVLDGSTLTDEERNAAFALGDLGWTITYPSGSCQITETGLHALAAEEQRLEDEKANAAKQEAAKEEERAFERKRDSRAARHGWGQTIVTCIFSIISAIIGVALGVWLEWRMQLFEMIARLFR